MGKDVYNIQQSILNSEVEERVFGEVEGAVRDVYWSEAISGATSQHGTELTREQMTGREAAEHMDGLDFEAVWTTTDGLPVQQWRIQDLSLRVDDRQLMVGESTDATVTLEMAASDNTMATTTAEYDLNTSAATIENGTLEATDCGTVELTASVAGHSDTVTVAMLAPPELGVADATTGDALVARDSTVTVDTTVENVGDLEGSDTFDLEVGGETVDSTTVAVDGREERSVAFRWTPTETGSYTLTVGEETVGTVEVVEPPEVAVTDASVEADGLLVGREATVSTTLENPDRLAGSETATLVAGDTVVESRDVSVAAETTDTTAFTWTPDEPGTYNLTVNSVDAGTVEAVPRSAVSMTNVTAAEQVLTGETAEVAAEIVNEADLPVETSVAYAVDDDHIETRSVTLDPGTNTVAFETELSETGTATHSVSVADATGDGETDVRAPARFDVTNLVAPETVDAGQEVTISATVANTGGVDGKATVDVTIDGATVTDKTVSVEADSSTRVSATFTLQAQGEHTYSVATGDDSMSSAITAESADSDQIPDQSTGGPTTQSGEETASGDGFGPGFGVVAALMAIIGCGVALRESSSL
ncbi:CARDB domain-containing protein [Halapricum desulfuricans]|uniref:CARDB domain-containing protein n=1 Tax=Halapricum desulfuricans TaxID=2841257 RepID=UPI001E40AB8A|nr:CARDB domain-containing protein [Halapricum desulfuricans]